MKPMLAIIFSVLLFSTLVQAEYIPSGRAKVFKGPEGEIITMIPVSDNTKMIVYAKDTYGVGKDKVMVFDLRNDNASPTVTTPRVNPQNPGETQTVVILSKREGQWHYADWLDGQKRLEYKLTYSEDLSPKVNVKKLVATAQEPK